jgi:ABC-2 type transport system ATP-binding protein
MIEVSGLTKKFGKKIALNDINLTFENGMYGLLGPNGAGKTTLMRTMLGLYKIQHGDIIFDGKSIKKDDSFMKQIGYLPQKFGLFKELTVYEMMEYIATLKKIKKSEQKAQIESCVEMVNLSEQINDHIESLSGGMLRRLGIAQAMLGNARVLIVDEPTAGLDPEERLRFKNLLATIKKDRIIIISTHIVEDVEALCDHIIIINQGHLVGSGDSEKVRQIAKNKVFHVPPDKESELVGKYFIEKRYHVEDQDMLRVLSNEIQPGEAVAPTIEDGYMCRVKGIA